MKTAAAESRKNMRKQYTCFQNDRSVFRRMIDEYPKDYVCEISIPIGEN
jgi:hypothetical protein